MIRVGDSAAVRFAATSASAALRALAAVAAGFALTAGLSLVLWALTPAGGSDAGEAVRGGAVAFAAAHFLPVTISGTALTLRPLLLTLVMIAVMMTAVGHARPVRGRLLEAVHAGVFTVVYALGVSAMVALAAPSDSARAGLLAPAAVAAVGAALSLSQGATDWRVWWTAVTPEWIRRSLHAAVTTILALVSASAVVLAAALAVSFPDALGIAQLTVRSVGDAAGVVLLCLAFVPNAVIAAIGYVSGAGFSVGAASFSPLAVHAADLPAVPLLAAVPSAQPGAVAWATVLAPIVAALAGAWTLRRVGGSRWQRLAAVGLAALTVGAATAGLAAVGGGGVAGGSWTTMGAEPLITGGLIAGMVLMVTASLVVPAGWASLAWRSGHDAVHGARADGPASGDIPAGEVDAGSGVADGAEAEDGVMPERDAPGGGDSVEDGVISVADSPHGESAVGGVASDAPAARDAQPDDPLADGAAPAQDAGPGTTRPGTTRPGARPGTAGPDAGTGESGGGLAQAG